MYQDGLRMTYMHVKPFQSTCTFTNLSAASHHTLPDHPSILHSPALRSLIALSCPTNSNPTLCTNLGMNFSLHFIHLLFLQQTATHPPSRASCSATRHPTGFPVPIQVGLHVSSFSEIML